jgi:hypothetical protein
MPTATRASAKTEAALDKKRPKVKRQAVRKAPDTLLTRRSAALTMLQTAGTWRPFYGPTGALLWRVPSERANGVYHTVYVEQRADPMVSCTCPDFTYPHEGRVAGPCKHILAVKTYQRAAKSHARHMAALEAVPKGRTR